MIELARLQSGDLVIKLRLADDQFIPFFIIGQLPGDFISGCAGQLIPDEGGASGVSEASGTGHDGQGIFGGCWRGGGCGAGRGGGCWRGAGRVFGQGQGEVLTPQAAAVIGSGAGDGANPHGDLDIGGQQGKTILGSAAGYGGGLPIGALGAPADIVAPGVGHGVPSEGVAAELEIGRAGQSLSLGLNKGKGEDEYRYQQ